jgi:hypothetical protein
VDVGYYSIIVGFDVHTGGDEMRKDSSIRIACGDGGADERGDGPSFATAGGAGLGFGGTSVIYVYRVTT